MKQINKPKEFGLSFDVELLPATEKGIISFEGLLTEDFSSFLLEQLKKEVPEQISYTDFYGEAEDFLAATNQPFSNRKEIAKNIYEDFLSSSDSWVKYDESNKCFLVHPKFGMWESGDVYSDSYKFISNIVKLWSGVVEKKIDTAKKRL